jgi:undecaprenyl-diphosphatase
MNFFEALILGLIQGITEFLPISSSGHLKIAQEILGTPIEENLTFTIVVHGATVLATIIVFWKKIVELFADVFKFQWNESTQYALKIIVSMVPIAIIGLFFKNHVEAIFDISGTTFVGLMLLITGALLFFAWKAKSGGKEVGFWHSLIIGISQAIAIIPGISRSGATISTALLLKIDRAKAAQFSFLMVIIPILGENILDLLKGDFAVGGTSSLVLLTGFVAAFVSGYVACKFMLKIVTKGKIQYFAIYCALIGVLSVIYGIL